MMDKAKTPSAQRYIAARSTIVPRGFGFVYHSRTIFCRAVPNPNITIRNFFIAVQDWMDASVFYHVSRGEQFADGEGLYRFREDEVGSILNMKAKWAGPVRRALETVADLHTLLGSIIKQFTLGLSRQVSETEERETEERESEERSRRWRTCTRCWAPSSSSSPWG
jgi:hypothetical protein